MDKQPTYDDVNLILRLYELRREEKLRKARDWFGGSFYAGTMEEFNQICPMGSDGNTYYRMVTSYWEMAASFVTAGVLNEDLFFESGGELLFVWIKIKNLVPQVRELYKAPAIARNLEIVANKMIARNPDGYEAMQQMIQRIRDAMSRSIESERSK